MIQLYGYWRSSSSYRVRIALALKGLDYDNRPVHLVQRDQDDPDYRRLNPQGYVPCLVDGDVVLTQSLAIMEYLDAVHPGPALLPADPVARAHVQGFAQTIACDIQPLQNVSVLNHLVRELHHDDSIKATWSRHWIARGLAALEARLADATEHACCFGEAPSLADVCLIPQMYNAERFGVDLGAFPHLVRVTTHCRALEAFQAAHPDNQPDAA